MEINDQGLPRRFFLYLYNAVVYLTVLIFRLLCVYFIYHIYMSFPKIKGLYNKIIRKPEILLKPFTCILLPVYVYMCFTSSGHQAHIDLILNSIGKSLQLVFYTINKVLYIFLLAMGIETDPDSLKMYEIAEPNDVEEAV